ncbi:MAG TPA: hypothetical protein DCS93_01110 [Microscillaceae bacterium]|nr:hypothetical protein [Microscillaceae bacterium]
MYTKLLITIIALLTCWVDNSQAQYIPKSQRKTHMKLHNIKIKQGEQAFVRRAVVYCDTLIMEDESILKVPHNLRSFTLYAKYCKIGKQCQILSRGKNGKRVVAKTPHIGESGTDAPQINLYLNIYALESLTVDARGGDGGKGKKLGIHGSGGDVNLHYFSPQIIEIQKNRNYDTKNKKIRSIKPTIVVVNHKGRMYFNNTRRNFNPTNPGKTFFAPTKFQSIKARTISKEERERKDGLLKINRQRTFIPPTNVKIKY